MERHERIMRDHPDIRAWLKNRPRNTKRAFAQKLIDFSEAVGVTPEEWRKLDKFEARDLAWKYVEPLLENNSAVARQTMVVLKSWYRNLNGEILPLDSSRGGKHNIRYVQKKAAYEKIPDKTEVFRIVDMVSSLRDKAILLTLFQSGIRINALCSLKYGNVKDQLDKNIITLKITWDIDDKLRGANTPYYFTFVNGEGAVTLRQYCKLKHENSTADTPLFYTSSGQPVADVWVRQIVKKCVKRAGFDPKTMWVHSFRKAFRKIIRQAPIDDDDKEQLMGHVIRGSRQAYFDRKDVDLIRKAYEKCNFTREIPESEVEALRKKSESQNHTIHDMEARITALEDLLQKYMEKSS